MRKADAPYGIRNGAVNDLPEPVALHPSKAGGCVAGAGKAGEKVAFDPKPLHPYAVKGDRGAQQAAAEALAGKGTARAPWAERDPIAVKHAEPVKRAGAAEAGPSLPTASSVPSSAQAAYARIAGMLIRGNIQCSVGRIARRQQPCTAEVAALPHHYAAQFGHAGRTLRLELSTSESERPPYPQAFLIQSCMDAMLARACDGFADWRATMGSGDLATDMAIHVGAGRAGDLLAELFTPAQLALLEQIVVGQLEGLG
jgi:hypothetical protein